MAKWVCFGPLLFNLIRWIDLCDKKNRTFVDCCNKILLNLSWKVLLSLPKARLSLSQTSPCFYVSAKESFENTDRKGEIAPNEQFLLYPQCFLPF